MCIKYVFMIIAEANVMNLDGLWKYCFFFFQAEDGIRDIGVTGVQTCALPISEVTRMQVRAIFEAACTVQGEGMSVQPEIMVPLVSTAEELRHQAALINEVGRQVMSEQGMAIKYSVGTMIELPRAALCAGKIAAHADFFSFGTNDLTQTTFGLSRDDAGRFLSHYVETKVLPDDPFQVLDRDGVGQLVRLGTERGRSVKPGLKVGICGEHGGEPRSIAFCHETGLDYVSCSPFRVPVARLAAAQAALEERTRSEERRVGKEWRS